MAAISGVRSQRRFLQVSLVGTSGQGFAVVHATGYSTNTFRLANRLVQEGERQRRGVGRAAWMRREVSGSRMAHLGRPRNGAGVSET